MLEIYLIEHSRQFSCINEDIRNWFILKASECNKYKVIAQKIKVFNVKDCTQWIPKQVISFIPIKKKKH